MKSGIDFHEQVDSVRASPYPLPLNQKRFADSLCVCLACFTVRTAAALNTFAAMPISSLGSEAYQVLNSGSQGRVIAVFNRSFYVQCDEGLFCVGHKTIGRGPLHVLLASDQSYLPKAISQGMPVSFACSSPHCATTHVTDPMKPSSLQAGHLFNGQVVSMTLNACSLKKTQQRFWTLPVPEQTNFGWILPNSDWRHLKQLATTQCSEPDSLDLSLQRQCLPAIEFLAHWLKTSLCKHTEPLDRSTVKSPTTNNTPTCVTALLGAGPGLTPAGDDLLAGVMLALHRLDRAELAAEIWEMLEPLIAERTNAISSAHLRLAASGQCSEKTLNLLEGIFYDNTDGNSSHSQATAPSIQALANAIGATSGWDTLAGMRLVAHAV